METLDVLTGIGGVSLSTMVYFLKQTMNDLKRVKEVAYETSSKLKVIENDYLNKIDQLNTKFDMLNDSIKDLIVELKELKKK
jgi:hypothetical protein